MRLMVVSARSEIPNLNQNEKMIHYLIYFLAKVVINAAHMKVPSMASNPAINLKSAVGT